MRLTPFFVALTLAGCGSGSDIVVEQAADTRTDRLRAAHQLKVNCPYNRALFQLPIALNLTAQRHDTAGLDAELARDWKDLQEKLASHVASLDELGGPELPIPQGGDYLANLLMSPALLTRVELESAADPLAATLPLLESVSDLVAGYDMATRDKINAALAVLEEDSPPPSLTLSPSIDALKWLLELSAELEELEPRVSDPAMKSDLRSMIDALEMLMSVSC